MMNLIQRKVFQGKAYILLGICLLALLQGSLGYVFTVSAQDGDENWTTPVNLSHSGAATNPVMVVIPTGQFFVVWNDQFAGAVYTMGDGTEWSPPQALSLPFAGFTPRLIVDARDNVHAFWLEEGILLHSYVRSDRIDNSVSWTNPQRLAESIVIFDAAVDPLARIHLSYIQVLETETRQPGVYYIRSNAGGTSWSQPALLYESPYLRSLTPENAQVEINTAGLSGQEGAQESVYVVWDNPSRQRVYFAKSLDDGNTWDQPLDVDVPVDGSVVTGPSRITMTAQGENVLLIWQSNNTGVSCEQYYQSSADRGINWQPKQRMLLDLPGCAQENDFLVSGDGQVFLMVTIQEQVYLIAWDGASWSAPQLQSTLSSFTDPETFNTVDFRCRQPVLANGLSLYVVGCDTNVSQDIWLVARQMDDTAEWFSNEQVWSSLQTVARSDLDISSPVLLTDENSRIHAFWSQSEGAGTTDGASTSIYYTRFENGQWSRPLSVITSPERRAEHPAVILDRDGRLLVVWRGGRSGNIYFSAADASRAVVNTAWSEPKQLSLPGRAGSSPDILEDSQGRFHVVYAVPLNEQRGIYLVQSEDRGATWSQPRLVFDAAAAGWGMVDQPRLALTGNGQMHLLWTQLELPMDGGPLALFYARSDDGGQNWSRAEMVMDKPVVWSRIIGVGQDTVHRVWQEFTSSRSTLWHEESQDSGSSWHRIAPVSIFGETIVEPAITTDRAGRLHLLQVVSKSPGRFVLQHWIWDGERWLTDDSLNLDQVSATNVRSLVSVVTPEDGLAVLVSGITRDVANSLQVANLFFTSRELVLPEVLPTPEPQVISTPDTAATPTVVLPTPQPTLIPTTVAPTRTVPPIGLGEGGDGNTDNVWLGTVVGPLLAGIIVLIVFIVGVRNFGAARR